MTLEKLKDLWTVRRNLPVNSRVRARVDQIFEWLDWANKFTPTNEMTAGEHTAKSDGCPTDNAGRVHELLLENVNKHFPAMGKEAIEKTWNRLANIQSRQKDFRTASEAKPNSKYESFNVNPVHFSNPDSWFFSYNYPWHIIQWMKEGQQITLQDDKDGSALRYKFILKFLWMLGTPDVLAVLSLQSFITLIPVFKELEPNFEANFSCFRQQNKWAQDIDDFKGKWKTLSEKLVAGLTGDQGVLTLEVKRELSRFLFEVSLSGDSVRDGLVMLEHGSKAIILYGPPGTGKTREAKILARRLLGLGDADDLPSDQVRLVQFHPGYSYQDFMGGILPKLDGETLGYKKSTGIFKKLCEDAKGCADRNFVLIIDEINRADLSAVFGELLFGLEYRGETVCVPWCGEELRLVIPSNVYIIGTMNTTDKSLIGFDLALRRRFSFMKLMPRMSALEDMPVYVRPVNGSNDGCSDRLVTEAYIAKAEGLNNALKDSLNLQEDKQIGHAYFLKLKDFCMPRGLELDGWLVNSYALEKLWVYHLEPLLEEYLGLSMESRRDDLDALKRKFCSPFSVDS